MLAAAICLGAVGCDFQKKLTISYTLRLWDDIPADWNADYYSLRLHQPVMLPASQVKGRMVFKTPKGQAMPPTAFTWTVDHLDDLGAVISTETIPGTIKVRKYTGKAKLNLALPAYDFQQDHELRISGSFNSFVPQGTTIATKLQLRF